MKEKQTKVNTGVTLAPDVLDYLKKLSQEQDRDRSWLINAIIREHAEQQGRKPTALKRKKS